MASNVQKLYEIPCISPAMNAECLFAIDVVEQRICFHQGLDEFLGYKDTEINLGWLYGILHPDERRQVTKITTRIQEVLNGQYETFNFPFTIAHQMKRADGTYIKVLRKMCPLLKGDSNNLWIYTNHCFDISTHCSVQKITFDVVLPQNSAHTKDQVLAYFSDLTTEKPIEFSEREVEVIKVWSEMDSAKLAAERLGVTLRTLETHLKNCRKKLGTRRTLDVVIYAKEKKLV